MPAFRFGRLAAGAADGHLLTALGVVLTVVYVGGLIMRPHPQVARLGLDSVAVLLLYLAGIAGLFAVANH